MDKPCFKCDAYVEDEAKCGVLVQLQGIPRADRDARAASIDELLSKRPCQFSPYIRRMAGVCINKRGLRSQIERDDIHNSVVVELLELDFRTKFKLTDQALESVSGRVPDDVLKKLEGIKNREFVREEDFLFIFKSTIGDEQAVRYESLILKHAIRQKDTFENFRSYATVIIQNAVRDPYWDFCCGTCAFYLEESKGLPSRCGNHDLEPVPGQQHIQVNYSTKPKTVKHSQGNGCSHYARKQFVDLTELNFVDPTELNLVTVPPETDVEETLAYMESLGPRQKYQARLLRLLLEGYTIEEIASQTGKRRFAISKELHGTSEKEDDGTGNRIMYHQAGARDVFRAIYTSAIFDLKREGPDLWRVVDRRDFSSDEVRPSFSGIARELSITKREAIERYIDGWDWINKGGKTMSGRKDDKDEEKPEQPRPARRVAKASEMQHPDFHALLSFAEDTLDREARGRIAAHTLICESCSAELEHIETEILPEMKRPISVTERLSWLAARLVGRVRGPREIEQESHAHIGPPAFVFSERTVSKDARGEAVGWRTLAVHGADERYRFLTVLDEDEAGELYLFMSIYAGRKGPVYCWPVEGTQVELPFIPADEKERHRYQAYLTDREVPVPEGVHVDPKINADERSEERKQLLAAFLEALERGEVSFRAAEQEIKP